MAGQPSTRLASLSLRRRGDAGGSSPTPAADDVSIVALQFHAFVDSASCQFALEFDVDVMRYAEIEAQVHTRLCAAACAGQPWCCVVQILKYVVFVGGVNMGLLIALGKQMAVRPLLHQFMLVLIPRLLPAQYSSAPARALKLSVITVMVQGAMALFYMNLNITLASACCCSCRFLALIAD